MRRLTLICLLAFMATAPLQADADGIPRLDPTDGSGTTYDFVMPQTSRSMDQDLVSFQRIFRGTLTVTQFQGESSFDAVMQIDITGDGDHDRTLSCTGWNGSFRFGMECSEDDGGEDFKLLITGRAVRFLSGRIALRKAIGHGFTESHTMGLTFGAISR